MRRYGRDHFWDVVHDRERPSVLWGSRKTRRSRDGSWSGSLRGSLSGVRAEAGVRAEVGVEIVEVEAEEVKKSSRAMERVDRRSVKALREF